MNHEEVIAALATVDSRSKSNTHRLDEMEKRQDNLDELVGTVKVLACREETVERDVREIKTDVKNLTSRPGKRWDAIVDKLIWAVLAAFVTYALTKIGL